MKVVGKEILDDFSRLHGDVRSTLAIWYHEAKEAIWKTPNDIRARYASASFIGKHVIFNIKGNRYRLDTIVAYNLGTVYIKRVGTHAEYSKWDFN